MPKLQAGQIVLVDTSVMLNDFIYRYPETGLYRQQNAEAAKNAHAYRYLVHEGLRALHQSGINIAAPEFALFRFAGLLNEYWITPELQRQEILFWQHNLKLIPTSADEWAKNLLAEKDQQILPDHHAWLLAYNQAQQSNSVGGIYTCQPNNYADSLKDLLLSPEKLMGDPNLTA